MTECAAFVAAVLETLDGAGPLADFLDEQGDPRGVLLRRRWKRWQKERWAATAADALDRASRWNRVRSSLLRWFGATRPERVAKVDDTFRRYVRRKFAAELPPAPKRRRR